MTKCMFGSAVTKIDFGRIDYTKFILVKSEFNVTWNGDKTFFPKIDFLELQHIFSIYS